MVKFWQLPLRTGGEPLPRSRGVIPEPLATMRHLCSHFSRFHLYSFVAIYLVFAGLTFFALHAGSDADRRENWVAAATMGAVSGPFTGAIARHFQPCCLQFSFSILPYSAVFLGAGSFFQIVPLPFRRFAQPLRWTLWCLGLLGWFGGGWISFFHALS